MKPVQTLEQFWQLSEKERRNTYISESITTQYPIKDKHEPLVSISSEFKKNGVSFLYQPPQDAEIVLPEPFLRQSAAKLLVQAAKSLPKGIRFKIIEGYRLLSYQQKIFKEVYEELKKTNKNFSKKELWEETTKYVADPTLCPPHTTGGTLDCTLVDEEGQELDMGNPINTVDCKSNTFITSLTKQQKENRKLLFSTLTYAGFVNLPTEWWHYSYGDQYWAIFYQKPYALYGKLGISFANLPY